MRFVKQLKRSFGFVPEAWDGMIKKIPCLFLKEKDRGFFSICSTDFFYFTGPDAARTNMHPYVFAVLSDGLHRL